MQIELITLTVEHIELVRSWRNSEFVSQFMYSDDQITKEQQLDWFGKVTNDDRSIYWIIVFKGQPVGLASITNIDKKNRKCFWAFYLSEEQYQGFGIGSFVEFKVIEYAFDVLGLNKICGEVFKFNEKVVKLHQRFGFIVESNYRQHIFKNGKYEDVVGLALLKDDWDTRKDYIKKLLKS